MKARNRMMNPPPKKLELPQAVLLVSRATVERARLWSLDNLRT